MPHSLEPIGDRLLNGWLPVAESAAGAAIGLTIHLLEHGAYRESTESRAFCGWTTDEIHAALNEATPSTRTSAAVERVGAALGAREGTGPDDHPLFRSQRRQGFERGRAETIRQILLSRGIEISRGFPADAAAFCAASEAVLVSAALACEDEADFLAALPPI